MTRLEAQLLDLRAARLEPLWHLQAQPHAQHCGVTILSTQQAICTCGLRERKRQAGSRARRR